MPPQVALVLDTNVALDWLLFADPRVAPALQARIGGGSRCWLASAAMRDELAVVLRRGLAARLDVAAEAAVLERWHRLARLLPGDVPAAPWRCRDADDQKFIDFALAHRAGWLLTRDRALLALAKRAAAAGLRITTPQCWLATDRSG